MVTNEHGLYYWNMDTGETRWQLEEGFYPRWWCATTDHGEWLWVLVRGGSDCAWELLVSYGGFWKNFLFYLAAVALFALGNLDFAFALVSFCLGPVFGCCLWSTSYFRDACAPWFNSGYIIYEIFDEFHIFSTLR